MNSSVTGIIEELGKMKDFQPQKLENGRKPKVRVANAPNHQAPSGHVACNAATMHLIWSETLRVADSLEKPFTFYDCHDVS